MVVAVGGLDVHCPVLLPVFRVRRGLFLLGAAAAFPFHAAPVLELLAGGPRRVVVAEADRPPRLVARVGREAPHAGPAIEVGRDELRGVLTGTGGDGVVGTLAEARGEEEEGGDGPHHGGCRKFVFMIAVYRIQNVISKRALLGIKRAGFPTAYLLSSVRAIPE